MTHELITRWIEALESDKYKQGFHRMRWQNDTFCALGVLCDVSGIGTWEISEKTNGWEYRTPSGARSGVLPSEINSILGDAQIDMANVMFMNDVKSLSFKDIATYIRSTRLTPVGTGH